MYKILALLLILIALPASHAHAAYTPLPPISSGGTGATTAQGALNNINKPGGTTAAYVVANCQGFNDQVAFTAAEAAAYATRTSITFPPNTGSATVCQISGQWQMTHPHVAVFGWPTGAVYDTNLLFNNYMPILRVNTGSIASGVANKCAIDIAGQADVSFSFLNLHGDSGSGGVVAICNTVNGGSYPTANLAILTLERMSIESFGTGVGCAENHATGACVGTLGLNEITVWAHASAFNNNDWAFNGNVGSDFFLDQSFVTSNFWGGVSATPSGAPFCCGAGTKITGNRIEYNGSNGTTYAALELGNMVGYGVLAHNDFDHNDNADVRFNGTSANWAITGNAHRHANASGGGAPMNTYYDIADSGAGSGHMSFTGESFGTEAGFSPAYLFRFDGTTDDYISIVGSTTGPLTYTTAPILFNTETPAHITFQSVGDTNFIYGNQQVIGSTAAVGTANVAQVIGSSYVSGSMMIGTATPLGTSIISVNGPASFGGGNTNHATCWKATGQLGYCSVVVDASGVCGTCN